MQNNDNFIAYVKTSRGQSVAMDAAKDPDAGFLPSVRNLLTEHDRRYHPHGYKPGQKCRYRDALRELTEEDSFDPAQVSEPAQQKLDESEDAETKSIESKNGNEAEPDSVSEWLPKMKDEIFAKVGSLVKGGTVKEDSRGIGYVEGGPSVKNDEGVLDQIQAVVDAARAEYGLDKIGMRQAHYESGSPYANKKPRIVFPYYRNGEANKLND